MSGRAGFPGTPGEHARPMTLHPDELAGDAVSAQELGGALEAAHALETAAAVPSVRPSADFADRVMARLAHEPTPGPLGYLIPVRRFGLGGLLASVRQAWGFVGRGSRPLPVRATALAYVLAIVLIGSSLTGLAAYGFAGALGLLGPDRSPAPTQRLQSPGPITEPPPSPESTPAPTAPPTAEPSTTPFESAEPSKSADDPPPAATPRETEDEDDAETSDAQQTPKPSETPKASRTPRPSPSDDD